MMLYLYRPVKMKHPAAGVTYGIAGQGIDLSGAVADRIWVADISRDSMFVFQLAMKCTVGQLIPEQLLDVIWDALS